MPNLLPRALIGGLPHGLIAEPIQRSDGALPKDRRGRIKITEVTLRSAASQSVAPGDVVAGVSAVDARWAVSAATRRWSGITSRFGARATEIANLLCQAGAVTVRARVTDDLRLGGYLSWAAAPEWIATVGRSRRNADEEAYQWRQRAQAATAGIEELAPGLAMTLRAARGNEPRLPVLVHAAEDLVAGVFHDGPRAFSQTHFGDSKARDDVASILTAAGATTDVLISLGIRRSPYMGLGGLLIVRGSGEHPVHLAEFDGPVRFRVDQALTVTVDAGCHTLLVIENLQAAEAICDHYRDVAVVWIAGQPADATLRIIDALAHGLPTLIAPDADLGGVRIANRIVNALSSEATDLGIIDVGEGSHPSGSSFGPDVRSSLAVLAGGGTPASDLAAACLARGYRVEQEALIRAAISRRFSQPKA